LTAEKDGPKLPAYFMAGTGISAGNQKERWIRFQGLVNDKNGPALMRLVDQFYAQCVEHIHLMISSVGGIVYYGANAFSHLRRVPIKISCYNAQTVQSIGVTLFCAGDERYCVPEATFMIHPVAQQVQGQLNAKQFQDLADSCNNQTRSIAQIISTTTGQTVEQVFGDMNQTRYFNAEESLSYGLVTGVVTNFFPAGTPYTVVEEDGTVRECVPKSSSDVSDLLLELGLPTGPILPIMSSQK
jgi:ATP-dependent Clp protease protease subunit